MPLNQASHSMTPNQFSDAGQPTGMFCENFPRADINVDGVIGATTLLTCSRIAVYPGDTITSISVITGATAGGTGTHNYFALYSDITVPALLVQSVDTPIVTPAANTVITNTLATPFTVPAGTNSLWVGFLFTGGTVPTLMGKTIGTVAAQMTALNSLTGVTNGLAVTATGAAGATAPATMASITQIVARPYFLLK